MNSRIDCSRWLRIFACKKMRDPNFSLSSASCPEESCDRAQRGRRLVTLLSFAAFVAALHSSCLQYDCASSDAFCDPLIGYLLYTDPAPTAVRLYWIRSQAPRALMRSNLDGSNIENLGGTFPDSPSAMFVDGPGGYLYYNVDSSVEIHRARLDGSENTVFLTDASGGDAVGLWVDRARNRLYWLNSASNQLFYASLTDGAGQTPVRTFGGTAIVGAYDPGSDMIFAAGISDVRVAPADGSSETLLNNSFAGLVDVDLDGASGLYLTDISSDEVIFLNRDGTGKTALVAGFMPGGLAYDPGSGLLYICDQTNSRIVRANSVGGDLATLAALTAGSNPVACSLEFTRGGLF
jgi:hypothetical protein